MNISDLVFDSSDLVVDSSDLVVECNDLVVEYDLVIDSSRRRAQRSWLVATTQGYPIERPFPKRRRTRSEGHLYLYSLEKSENEKSEKQQNCYYKKMHRVLSVPRVRQEAPGSPHGISIIETERRTLATGLKFYFFSP